MKPSEIIDIVRRAIRNNYEMRQKGLNSPNILIKARPGVGKTACVSQACALEEADMIWSHPVTDEPIDYKGLPDLNQGEAFAQFKPYGNMSKAITATKPTVWMMDDLGQALKATQASIMQPLGDRRLDTHAISDWVIFVAATNRKEDKAGVTGLLEPVKSRFSTIIEMETDLDDWCEWALANGMPTELVAFVRFRPNFLVDWTPSNDIVNGCCPRTIAKAGELMIGNIIPPGHEFEVFSGCAGDAFAAEFTGFLKVYRGLPNPDVVLMNPDKFKVPTDPATLYALAGALASRANEENASRFFKASSRMPGEFGVLTVRDALRRDPDLANVRAFIDWTVSNQSVML